MHLEGPAFQPAIIKAFFHDEDTIILTTVLSRAGQLQPDAGLFYPSPWQPGEKLPQEAISTYPLPGWSI